jgi:hypothetical protein
MWLASYSNSFNFVLLNLSYNNNDLQGINVASTIPVASLLVLAQSVIRLRHANLNQVCFNSPGPSHHTFTPEEEPSQLYLPLFCKIFQSTAVKQVHVGGS